jgi:hypothetical protein
MAHTAAFWGVQRGRLQEIQAAAAMYSGMAFSLCRELHWSDMTLLIDTLRDRLDFGVQVDLLPLMALPGVTARKARALMSAGYGTVAKVAACSGPELARALASHSQFRLPASAGAAGSGGCWSLGIGEYGRLLHRGAGSGGTSGTAGVPLALAAALIEAAKSVLATQETGDALTTGT